jgi:hypothetical protein
VGFTFSIYHNHDDNFLNHDNIDNYSQRNHFDSDEHDELNDSVKLDNFYRGH